MVFIKTKPTPLCKCGCGEETSKYYNPAGIFKTFLRYKVGHRPGQVRDGLKLCPVCKIWFPADGNFYPIRGMSKEGGPTYYGSQCKACYRHKYATSPELRARAKDSSLRYRYGITLVQLEELKATQNYICPLCLKRAAAAVDHCHDTGRIRGILCQGCNIAIAVFGDDEEAGKRVAAYLKNKD